MLDEKEVNIDILRENVRTYQDLQRTLDKIKLRMGRLEKIEGFYRQVEDGTRKDRMYEYFLDRIEVDILEEEIRQLESAIVHDTYRLERWNQEIAEAQKEKEERQAIRDNLYAELASDKDFIARDEQQKKLLLLEERERQLSGERQQLLTSVNMAKAEVNRLLQVPDADDCIRSYGEQLGQLEKMVRIDDFKNTLQKVIAYKNHMSDRVYKRRAELDR